uniref:Putative ovule protein n=1 Tax=Solanum chacoense TaxID=4108 RepID=A0A0V0GXR1_SOLCH
MGERERDNSVWVQQNLVKLSKLLGVDFQGHEEEALELLLRTDSSRHARKMEIDSVCRKGGSKVCKNSKA